MNKQQKIINHLKTYAVTWLFIALSVFFIVVSGLDMNYVASQLLLRLNRSLLNRLLYYGLKRIGRIGELLRLLGLPSTAGS